MFKELKKTMFEEMKEGMMIMSNPIENISIKIEMIKNNQMDIMKLKNTIKLKVHQSVLTVDLNWQKKELTNLGDRSAEMQPEETEKKEEKWIESQRNMEHH